MHCQRALCKDDQVSVPEPRKRPHLHSQKTFGERAKSDKQSQRSKAHHLDKAQIHITHRMTQRSATFQPFRLHIFLQQTSYVHHNSIFHFTHTKLQLARTHTREPCFRSPPSSAISFISSRRRRWRLQLITSSSRSKTEPTYQQIPSPSSHRMILQTIP